MILLPESDEDLLRECEVDTFRSSGPGGQHVNKTESAVRLTHLPSGVVVTSQEERSQHRNKAICLEKLREKIAKLRSEEHTSELQSQSNLVCRLLLEKKKNRDANLTTLPHDTSGAPRLLTT